MREPKLKKVLEWMIQKGYTIDKDGVVKNPLGKILNGTLVRQYLKIGIKIPELSISSYAVKIHKLQAYIKFKDEIFKEGILVRHLNENPLDNSYDNIEIGSQQQNMLDRSKEKLSQHSKNRKPIPEDIGLEIINDRSQNNLSYDKLSKKYNIARSTIMDYCKKRINSI